MKGKKGDEGSQFFRRALVVGQFAVSIGLITAMATVILQTWKAGLVNPVETLKYE